MIRVRFAPSPTGFLHVGNIRIALINWLFARQAGGRFLLRLDDTDEERGTAEFAAAIKEDLHWLGLEWDDFARQSERLARYDLALDKLKEIGRLYPCYETPQELEIKRKIQLSRKLPPVYDRAALDLSDAQRAAFEAEGRAPHWRFRLDHQTERWDDLTRGPVHFDCASLSDPVLVRADGRLLYTLCSIVDDIELGVSHVLRGEDHVANTAVQLQIFRSLDAAPPVFGHLALLTGAGGEGLSKRLGSLSIRSLRADGLEAMAINSLLARLGSAQPVRSCTTLDELVAGFDITAFGRAAAKFDPAELEHLNARILHDTPFAAVAERLAAMGLGEVDEAAWQALRGNLVRLADIADLWRIVTGPVTPVIEDPAFIARAAALLPGEPWDETTWKSWTSAIKAATGASGRALFRPLRLALTGLDHGPEMKYLLALIGPHRARARLAGKTI
jgi:glutamyl-tRNA synthetase